MKIVFALIVTILLVGVALAYPYRPSDVYEDEEPRLMRYIPLRRFSRRVPTHGRVLVQRPRPIEEEEDMLPVASSHEPIPAETGYGHSHHPYDYVDYGAYTGGYGAFGWYSDHPVYTYGH